MVTDWKAAAEQVPETPALVVNEAAALNNLNRLQSYTQQHRLAWRPHTKTHKSQWMARQQVAAGAQGLTVAKAGEAGVMARESNDILVAYPALDPSRARKLAELATSVTLRVAIDSIEAASAFAAAAEHGSTLGLLVDIDIGFHRTGVQSASESLELARHVRTLGPSAQLDGIFFYPGHIWAAPEDQIAELQRIDALLEEAIDLWKQSGIPVPIVSGGSTPTAYQSHHVTSLTEIRPGTFVYNDANTLDGGYCSLDDCAAAVICTVVSNAVPGKVVIDGGTKTFTSDRNICLPDGGFGKILGYPEARLVRLSEEHGEIDLKQGPRPRLGERLAVIPNHICPCVNLHEAVWRQQSDGTLERDTVDARGLLT